MIIDVSFRLGIIIVCVCTVRFRRGVVLFCCAGISFRVGCDCRFICLFGLVIVVILFLIGGLFTGFWLARVLIGCFSLGTCFSWLGSAFGITVSCSCGLTHRCMATVSNTSIVLVTVSDCLPATTYSMPSHYYNVVMLRIVGSGMMA
jgi:hypothetical protein